MARSRHHRRAHVVQGWQRQGGGDGGKRAASSWAGLAGEEKPAGNPSYLGPPPENRGALKITPLEADLLGQGMWKPWAQDPPLQGEDSRLCPALLAAMENQDEGLHAAAALWPPAPEGVSRGEGLRPPPSPTAGLTSGHFINSEME